MREFFLLLTIIISLLIVFFILIQGRGAGLGSAWGAGERYQTRRGIEKTVLWLTSFLVFLFLIISLINLLLR
ncbi:MAG: preprotein translocase subunit SecG [Patescibacteria group bacterium]|nr:preprotein translocase subunit SecG [Patescibacteria group bacterium]